MSRLTDNLKVHTTYIIRQFSLSVASTSDISIKYLYSSFSFSINIKAVPVLITLTGVPSVMWGLL